MLMVSTTEGMLDGLWREETVKKQTEAFLNAISLTGLLTDLPNLSDRLHILSF